MTTKDKPFNTLNKVYLTIEHYGVNLQKQCNSTPLLKQWYPCKQVAGQADARWTQLFRSGKHTNFSYKLKSLSRIQLFVTPWTGAYQEFLHPWNSPGKKTAVGCHFLLQGIFLTQGSNSGLYIVGRHFTIWATWEAVRVIPSFQFLKGPKM